MPRIRTFKPEFFRSPDTAKASHAARILFMAMWSWADDFGVGETNLYGLLGFAFPDEDELTVKDLQTLLAEVRGSYGVRFYRHRGRFFYAVPSWDSHQKTERRANAKNPGPDDPDSLPDLRFELAAEVRGKSADSIGESSFGTGEQGNIGTDLVRATEVCHQSADAVAPPRKCSRHINNPNPPDCGGCASARREHKAWTELQARAERDQLEDKRRQKAAEAQALIDCNECDEDGWRYDDREVKCNHQEVVNA